MLIRQIFHLVATAVLVVCGACSDPDGYPGGGRLEVLPGSAGGGELNSADANDAPADSALNEENFQVEPADRRGPAAVVVTDGH